jgi:hypothetical protein
MQEWQTVIQGLRDLGFPIAVAAFVLLRLETVLRQIRDDQRDMLGVLGARRRRGQRAQPG